MIDKRFISLKSRIMVSTVVPLAVIFLIMISVIFAALFNSVRSTVEAEFSAIGQEYANIFRNKMDNAVNYLSIMASTLEMQAGTKTADRVQLQRTTLNIFDNYGLIDGSSVYFEHNMYDGKDAEYIGSEYGTANSGRICYYFYIDDGKTAYLPEGLVDDIEFELPHYTEAKRLDKPIYTEPVVHEINGRNIPMFTITYPVHDNGGMFIGAVTVDLFLEDIYSQLQARRIYETGYIVITNDKDQVIYSPVFDDVGKSRNEAGVAYDLPAKNGAAVYSNSASRINGRKCFVTTIPVYIPEIDSCFYISVAAPTREIYSSGVSLVLVLAASSFLLIAGISLILYYLVGKITTPVMRIAKSANEIADGNMAEIMERDIFDENDNVKNEVHILFMAINKMLSQINEVQKIRLESLEMKHEKEKAEAEARAKGNFLAKMSHEIRTPMNAITGMSELILRKDLEQDVYENALGIKSASSNLLSIINDILDFSKIESGMMEIVEAPYQFASLVNDVIGIIRIRMMEKPIQFAVYIDRGIPASLMGDEVRIRQIILNLLNNAVKYTEEGFISLAATAVIRDNMAMLNIDISDSGIGIKEEDIGSLFRDFVQMNAEKNKGVEGTGLGLAIASSLCNAMGGDITVRSEYGKGSTFTVSLPQKFDKFKPFATVENSGEKSVLLYETRGIYESFMIRSLENLGVYCKNCSNIASLFENLEQFQYLFASSFCYYSIKPALDKLDNPPRLVVLTEVSETFAHKDARILTMPAHSLSIANILNDVKENFSRPHDTDISFMAPTARILIVDDITANLKVAEGLMAPYEMHIDLCNRGGEAIRMIEENRYDLVFMDHMMPEMDGLETTGHIRAMEDEYFKKLPIVALTANAVSGVREMFIQNGMDDFLAKPIEMSKLNGILEKWIPKEKRDESVRRKPAAGDSDGLISKLRTVPELSVDRALSVVGGSESAYERIVRLAIRLLPENIGKLNELIETDLPLYAIEAHGIKGVLNNIGAYTLGETGFKLETLSKSGDWEACRAIHNDFIGALDKFVEKVTPLTDKPGGADRPEGVKEQLLEAFPKIEAAADLFDSILALEILMPISEFTYGQETDKVITGMIEAFERFDFDEALLLLNELENKVKINRKSI